MTTITVLVLFLSCINVAIKSQTTEVNRGTKAKVKSDDYDRTKNPFFEENEYDDAKLNPFHGESDESNESIQSVIRRPPIPPPRRNRASSVSSETWKTMARAPRRVAEIREATEATHSASQTMLQMRPLPAPRSQKLRRRAEVPRLVPQIMQEGSPVPTPRFRNEKRLSKSLELLEPSAQMSSVLLEPTAQMPPPRPPKTFESLNVTLKWKVEQKKAWTCEGTQFMAAVVKAYPEENFPDSQKTYFLHGLSNHPGSELLTLRLEGPAEVRSNPYDSEMEIRYRLLSGNPNPPVYAVMPNGGYIIIKSFTSSYVQDKSNDKRYPYNYESITTNLNKKKSKSCKVM